MYLGIDESTNNIYESRNFHGVVPLKPTPFIFNIRFGVTAEEAIAEFSRHSIPDYKFREDLYDPVSRVKRGRVYVRNDSNISWFRYAETEHEKQNSENGMVRLDLPTYGRRGLDSQFAFAAIGTERRHTAWRIVSVEPMINDEELLTLQPVLFLGILPDVEPAVIPAEFRDSLLDALNGVVTDMKRAMPGSVIDRCRGATALAIRSAGGRKDKDLADLAKDAEEMIPKKLMVANCARVINLLHTRAKENTCHDKDYRPPNERDAELAVHCLACILTEFRFVK